MKYGKRNKVLRAGAILALSMSLLVGSSLNAFASTGEEYQTSGVTVEEILENEPEETSEETSGQEEESVSTSTLTPDGNLTLVDDISEEDSEEMQFITVATKSGNYFYIIIDRNSDDENVYFLNLVDESDLLALMDEEEQEAYSQTIETAETEQEPVTSDLEQQDEQKTEDAEEPESDIKESASSSALLLIVFLVIGGGVAGGYYFFKIKPGKQSSNVEDDMEFYDDEEYENEDSEDFADGIEFYDLDDGEYEE